MNNKANQFVKVIHIYMHSVNLLISIELHVIITIQTYIVKLPKTENQALTDKQPTSIGQEIVDQSSNLITNHVITVVKLTTAYLIVIIDSESNVIYVMNMATKHDYVPIIYSNQ